MKIDELLSRFSEIPPSLREEAELARYGEVFDRFLRIATKPSPCSADQKMPGSLAYQALISPMGFIDYGLPTVEKTVERLEGLLRTYEADPEEFERGFHPPDAADGPRDCPGG
jgi:hypothetical protein